MDDSFGDKKMPAAMRGMNRDSLLLKAELRFPHTNETSEVRIRNLSAGGLMAEVPTGLVRGERIEINLHSIGWVGGHVAWVSDGRVGIAFDHPINPKDARKPVGISEMEIPPYLKRLNLKATPGKLRRV
jgi:hypothetical protein